MLFWMRFKQCIKARLFSRRPDPPVRVLKGTDVGKPVPIASLIFPLRYDILVRRDFFQFYNEHAALFASDLDVFLEGPPAMRYYTWFRDVYVKRFLPELSRSSRHMRTFFRYRVEKSAALYRLLSTQPFDVAKPISLQSGLTIEHERGVSVDAEFYAGDGCHRLAFLYALGFDDLPPEYYEVRVFEVFQPLDNTALLLQALPAPQDWYWRFLAEYYCDGNEMTGRDAVLEYVRAHKAEKLREVASVIEAHAPLLARAKGL
jgi:hypothetical protein